MKTTTFLLVPRTIPGIIQAPIRAAVLTAVLALGLSANALAFGAIAVDDEAGLAPSDVGWGFSTGHDTPAEAALYALDQCRKAGNGECRVAARFEACGAYVVSRSRFEVGWGPTRQDALFMALNACGPDCRVVVAECE